MCLEEHSRAVGAEGAGGRPPPPVFSEFYLFNPQERDLQGKF